MPILSSVSFAALLLVAGGASAQGHPTIDVERLGANTPGWLLTSSIGDATEGSVEAEKVIWPMWYLHWRPLEDGVGRRLSRAEARQAIEQLWDGLVFDAPLDPQPVSMPAHDGFVIEVSTAHGERRTRYYIWACPESGRLIIVDTNMSLLVNAPERLLDWERDMARTVRCHEGARVESFPYLTDRYEIPDCNLSYSHPPTWRPLKAYRVVTEFANADLAVAHSGDRSSERGQDLVLDLDAIRQVLFSWAPAGDFPLSYDLLQQRVEDHWQKRAKDIMTIDRKVSNNVWIADGIARTGHRPSDVPPTQLAKFRAWLWRENDVDYFAVAYVGGIRFGRRRPPLPLEMWNRNLEEMFQACVGWQPGPGEESGSAVSGSSAP